MLFTDKAPQTIKVKLEEESMSLQSKSYGTDISFIFDFGIVELQLCVRDWKNPTFVTLQSNCFTI